ncbi:hypothetical protein G3495_01705 [Shewanella baltica]|uniref:hypothetical protein n=1 Tax=Shewanella baltica TaxID=62322 RepID=UPI0001E10F96|nr:hypothetical protein [Shewanella baltica]AEG10412.1 hypothetical protein Sbal175_1135 [Shewanella baltica BA175]EHQ16054.1 hypothetical protein Sbal183_3171 [Shewanella baltica OS183]MCS6233861.1 hypothetical protein [Shewanella baltica]MCS6268445.1 hypothetical protein [Shewanella baltica]
MMANWITKTWQVYIQWCDRMGLTPENRRCCMPRLEDPPLAVKCAKATTADETALPPEAHSNGKSTAE